MEQESTLNSIETLNSWIEDFLNQKKNLSKTYIAKKCDITLPFLIMILKGKRRLNQNLAVKILNVLKRNSEDISQFLGGLQLEREGKEVQAFKVKERADLEKNILNEEITRILAHDNNLYNAVIDLTWGPLHKDYLVRKYGMDIINNLMLLVDKKFLNYDGITFRLEGGSELSSKAEHIFRFVRNILANEESNYILKQNPGSIRYQVEDVSEKGFDKIKNLLADVAEQVDEIVQAHKESPIEGKGVRMGFVGLVTKYRRG